MENVVELFILINGIAKRIELFKDEKITVTSSIQNTNDIGKVFTDFSQSFTVPATDYNNAVFSHWYESDVDNGFNHKVRYNGFININTVPFREGSFQLEKANRKNGSIESYSVTFYGNLTQLKELFKEDKLNTLKNPEFGNSAYAELDHDYNSTQVINRIIGTEQSVMYPLLGSDRKFEYETGNSGLDITTSSGAIHWNNLFPAIKITDIFGFIQSFYGITFTGSFLDSIQFSKLRLLLKNSESVNYFTPPTQINFNTKSITQNNTGRPQVFDDMDLTTDTLSFNWDFDDDRTRRIICPIVITPTVSNIEYKLVVMNNGIEWQVFDNLFGNQTIYFYDNSYYNDPTNYNFTFFIQSNSAMTFTSYVEEDKRYENQSGVWGEWLIRGTAIQSTAQSTATNIEIRSFVPDITVVDFFNGILKMFNLVIVPNSTTSFELVPLELYYQQGRVLDLTKYIKSEEFDIERPKLFKSIKFEYEESKSILNNAFYNINGLRYGDLVYTNDKSNESSNYEIKAPFEDILFERTEETEHKFLTATFIDKDLKPYTPKPVFIYPNGLITPLLTGTHRIKIKKETGEENITTYNRFSNEIAPIPSDFSYLMSTNWGEFQSPYYQTNASSSLYNRHYRNYITNLYDIKTRVYKIKAILPDIMLGNTGNGVANINSLKLSDRIIIRDKRFIINSMTVDLTSGETDLDLITDYREVDNNNTIGYRYSSSDSVLLDNTAQSYQMTIYKNEFDSFSVTNTKVFATIPDKLNQTEDVTITIAIEANTTGADRLQLIDVDYSLNGITTNVTLKITQKL